MNKKIRFTVFTVTVLLCVNISKAQICGSSNLALHQLIDEAEVVVTGKTINKQCFWNNDQSNIYTQYQLEAKQSTKSNNDKIYILVEGGTIEDITFEVFGLPNLSLQNEGVFFLNKNNILNDNKANGNYYNLKDIAVYNTETNSIENNSSTIAVDEFNGLLKEKHKTVFSFVREEQKHYKQQATISSINPVKIAGGNNELLTINGTGFGSLSGNAIIAMRDASSLNSSLYVDIDKINIKKWSNTQIKFVVPGDEITTNFSGVASGKIRITDSSGAITTSLQKVEISYNKKVFKGKSVRLRGKNLQGEILFYVERNLINDGALPAVKRAFGIWNCATGSNFVYAGIVDNVCKEYDEQNVICYDTTVPTYNLAITRVVSRNCSSIDLADQVDADLTFNPNFNWSFTDDLEGNQFHFESVLLHELGHAFMLGHVVNIEDIMYPSLINSLAKVTLTNNDVDGGISIMKISTSNAKCSDYGPVESYNRENCKGCNSVINVKSNNVTENSVFLNWEDVRNTSFYKIRYRFKGSQFYEYSGKYNKLILYDLPACTTVEFKISAICNNDQKSESETTYRFITLGCR